MSQKSEKGKKKEKKERKRGKGRKNNCPLKHSTCLFVRRHRKPDIPDSSPGYPGSGTNGVRGEVFSTGLLCATHKYVVCRASSLPLFTVDSRNYLLLQRLSFCSYEWVVAILASSHGGHGAK